MRMLELFAGHRLGIITTQFVEINPDVQTILRSAKLALRDQAKPGSEADRTSPMSPSMTTSKLITQAQERLTSSGTHFPARAKATREINKDYLIQHHLSKLS